MANFHSRSNSLPSKSHPTMDDVETHIYRLKSSQSASTSSNSLCLNLAILRELHEGINDMIQLPSVQQALSHEQGCINKLLEGSLGTIDLCGFSRDVVYSIKESIQELESSIRRNRGESSTSDEINAYMASRKKIIKKVNKCIKNLKNLEKSSSSISRKDESDDLKVVATMMKEAEALDFSILKSVLLILSGEKESSNKTSPSLFSKFTLSSRVHCQETGPDELTFLNIHKPKKNMDSKNMLKQLQSSEMMIQELEEGLEALFKCLIKTRVSLLNILSH